LFALGVERPVVGTEILPDLKSWQMLQTLPGAERLVLSLDYRKGEGLGPVEFNQQPEFWPETVIAMSLDQVGSQLGPDWILLEQLRQKRPQGGEILAAGGICCLEDLRQLATWGVSGALLASALHNGSLSAVELRQLL